MKTAKRPKLPKQKIEVLELEVDEFDESELKGFSDMIDLDNYYDDYSSNEDLTDLIKERK